jgi:hypothetical protein
MGAHMLGGKGGQFAVARRGKQSLKQLAKHGGTLTNIEIKEENIKSFESIARKYGIDFAVKKDISEQMSKYLVFFKNRDADAMTAAFREFSARQLNKSEQKPSIMQALQRAMEKVKTPVFERSRERERER